MAQEPLPVGERRAVPGVAGTGEQRENRGEGAVREGPWREHAESNIFRLDLSRGNAGEPFREVPPEVYSNYRRVWRTPRKWASAKTPDAPRAPFWRRKFRPIPDTVGARSKKTHLLTLRAERGSMPA